MAQNLESNWNLIEFSLYIQISAWENYCVLLEYHKYVFPPLT